MRKILLAGLLVVVVSVAAAAVAMVFKPNTDPEQQAARNRSTYFSEPAVRPAFADAEREPCHEHNTARNPYFGGLHIHTSLSSDAYAFDTRSRPEDAYIFARGGEVLLPPLDASGEPVRPIRNARPLDFAAVTDHAEYLGESLACLDPSAPGYGALSCRVYRGDLELPVPDLMKPLLRLASFAIFGKRRSEAICGEDGSDCIERSEQPWLEIQQAAERWYDRSANCEFTTFVGYEYTLAEKATNLHRNVIFANAAVPPLPLSAKEAPRPELLWEWLEQSCIASNTGCDAMAIPHNSNWSSGRMFFPEFGSDKPLAQQRELAALRSRVEPLVEVMQVKGDSECRQGLYGVNGADEWCDFEKLRLPTEAVEDCRDGVGEGGMMLKGCLSRHAYARYGLIQGLAEQQRLGVNPFRYGLIAASDTHNGTPGAVSEVINDGAHGMDSTPQKRLIMEYDVPGGIAKGSPVRYNPGGLAGVWAEENSREALFAAMRRRETFGTSGSRIVPRLFAAWDLPENLCASRDMVAQAYAGGVPMGGELTVPADRQGAPVFVASALRDAVDGGLLQRLQIIKGWMDADGVMQQRIYDIAGGDTGASVDPQSCQVSGPGYAELCGQWRDPDFDPQQAAVYYLRVLENPSCRWSSWECSRLTEHNRPPACSSADVAKTIQERAWTSPIWVLPE